MSEDFVRQGKAYKSTDYVWDRENRLASVTYSDASRPSFLPSLEENMLEFIYDDFGNRIKKSANGSDTWYVNNGLSVLNEIDGSGVVNSVVQGLGQIAEIDADGELKFIHQDVLDSTVLISDSSGQVVQQYEYDVFGSVIGADGDSGSSIFSLIRNMTVNLISIITMRGTTILVSDASFRGTGLWEGQGVL